MLNFKKWILKEMANGNPAGEPEKEKIPVTAVFSWSKKEMPPTKGKKSPTEKHDSMSLLKRPEMHKSIRQQ